MRVSLSKTCVHLVAFACALIVPVSAQQQTKPSASANVEQELIALEHKAEQAYVRRDAATFETLLEPTFIFTDEQGQQQDARRLLIL
jgi:hypothetical protein